MTCQDELVEVMRVEYVLKCGAQSAVAEGPRGDAHAGWHELKRDDADVWIVIDDIRKEGAIGPESDSESVEEDHRIPSGTSVWPVPV